MVKKEISKIKKDGGRDGMYTESSSKSPERSGSAFSMAHHHTSNTNSNSFIHKSNGGVNSAYLSSTNNTGGHHN
jgi:hypothetical protein